MTTNRATALRIFGTGASFRSELQTIDIADPTHGQVLVKVEYSSVNYKDALAGTGKMPIIRTYPLTGGIDLSGTIIKSKDDRFSEGDLVLVTGCGLSENKNGGYSTLQLLSGDDVVLLPKNLSTKEAMILGTAGFTAALSLFRMEMNGLQPSDGPVLITGATGGVGSLAVNMYSKAGYQVSALSRKTHEFKWLKDIGASQCIDGESYVWGFNPMESTVWAAALDNLGGAVLAGILREVKPWGHVALCGMAAGTDFESSVMPFIIRGVSLIGINSSGCAMQTRQLLWDKLAESWKPEKIKEIHRHTCTLETLDEAFERLMSGGALGRTVVQINC